MKDKLPSSFVIKHDSENPLWDKYIKWLNETYEWEFEGTGSQYYYGYYFRPIVYRKEDLPAEITILTLDQWHKLAYPEYEVVMVMDKPSDNGAVLKEKKQQLSYLASEANDFYRDISTLYQMATVKERVRLENIKIALDNAVNFLTEDINRLNP